MGNDLQSIPGVGPSIARDLEKIGIREVADLRHRNPELLYNDLCELAGGSVDRCVLYVFRCAVYFATERTHDPALLKWWTWKDRVPTGETGLSRRTGMSDADILVVVSKVKQYIKATGGMNTSGSVAPALSALVKKACDAAIEAAKADGRKTVMDRDVTG